VRKLIASSFLCFCALFLVQATAHAQQIDVAYGGGSIHAPAATSTTETLSGGYYNTISGDVLFFHHLGAGAEVSWRGSKNNYLGNFSLPYRPVFFDVGAVFDPTLPMVHFIQPQLEAGIGAEDIRFYCSTCYNPFYNTTYVSSKHLMGHLGAGLKFYLLGPFFVRPEVGWYLVHNNAEFSSVEATEFNISIGFTLGSH
jgi:hypothetical protein